jgi:hypothetical protein
MVLGLLLAVVASMLRRICSSNAHPKKLNRGNHRKKVTNHALTGMTEVAAKITGRRYCSHHGSEVDALAGCIVVRNKSRRWMCFACQKKSEKRNAEIRDQIKTV